MVYKKFIKRNGKTYGPYVYHSKRVNGKVVSEYRGPEEQKDPKKIWSILIVSILIISLGAILFFSNFKTSGNVVLNLEGSFNNGNLSNGKINLLLDEGESIPTDSVVSIENGGEVQNYSITDLVSEEEIKIINAPLTAKEEFPKISFQLGISVGTNSTVKNESSSSGRKTPTTPTENITKPTHIENVTKTIPENITETIPTTQNKSISVGGTTPTKPTTTETTPTEPTPVEPSPEEKTPTETTTETTQTPTESIPVENTPTETTTAPVEATEPATTEPTQAPITGGIISNFLGMVSKFFTGLITGRVTETSSIISGEVSKEDPFIYKHAEKDVSLVSGSIKYNGEKLPDETISIEKKGNEVTVKTNYSIKNNKSKTRTLSIGLSKLNKPIVEGKLKIQITNNNTQIFSFDEIVSNESTNKTQEELTNITDKIFNESINTSKINLESINLETNFSEEEKDFILSTINETNFTTTVNTYKERFLVDFSFAGYTTEHSYPNTFSEEELTQNIGRDKYLWIKDIINTLSEKKSSKEKVENSTLSSSIF